MIQGRSHESLSVRRVRIGDASEEAFVGTGSYLMGEHDDPGRIQE